jgi:hypothetical protein
MDARGRGQLALLAGLCLVAAAAGISGMRSLTQEREVLAEERRALRDSEIADELIAMRDADQEIRALMFGAAPDTAERGKELNAERERLDHKHVLRLAEIVDELGDWPTISRFDALSSQSACAIAVHGVKDMEFMARAQVLMEPHARTGDADPECWAQVTDRLLVHKGELQLFGTQMRTGEVDGKTRWGAAPVHEPDLLLARRAEIGLSDYPEYLARMRRDYHVPESVIAYPDEPVLPHTASRGPDEQQ